MKKTCGIYIIKNKENNKVYIGQSINCEERIKQHFRDLKNKTHENIYLQRTYNKYGKEKIGNEILIICDRDSLDYFEVLCIEKFNSLSPNGYNIEVGGKSGKRYTESMSKKHSERMIGKKIGNKNKRFVGIRFRQNGWEADISINKKQVYIGRYATEEEAALAYDKVALLTYNKTFNFSREYVESTDLSEKPLSSNYVGITKRVDTRRGRFKITWRARVQINKKITCIGDFISEKEAAQQRNDYIIKHNLPLKLNVIGS